MAREKWDRFFATCQDAQIPINFHIGSGTWEGEVQKWWDSDRQLFKEDGSLNGPLSVWSSTNIFLTNFNTVANLILAGVLERFRRLKFVTVESGVGWIPFVLESFEYFWDEYMSKIDRAKFTRRPTRSFVEQIYACYWFESRDIVKLYVKKFRSDNLMFETDFPHPQCIYPNIQENVSQSLAGFTEEVRRKILYRNAEKVYGYSLETIKTTEHLQGYSARQRAEVQERGIHDESR
ncbi:MAG: amidohydrolase family protein [Steroidobacteraceae bacterium]